MECPACHKVQLQESIVECQFCGLIFEKWHAKQEVKPSTGKFRALLDNIPGEIALYRVDREVRTLFGLLLFFVHPAVNLVYPLIPKSIFPSSYALLAFLCFIAGTLIGMVADKRGYSGIFTAGGSGLLGGVLRFFALCILLSGTFSERVLAALPTFAVYSSCAFFGGALAWIFRKFFKITL